jgi:hypothetical protein
MRRRPSSQSSQSVRNGMPNFGDPAPTAKALEYISACLRNVCCLAASEMLERRQRLKIASAGEQPRERRSENPLFLQLVWHELTARTQRIMPLSLMSERVEYTEWVYLLYARAIYVLEH